ncbi:unnamed protein product [[Actinomadura] parvosata subsp. kistnae]|nr:unnamed protein product [Actinomadura parvosata subsp. kistnae]
MGWCAAGAGATCAALHVAGVARGAARRGAVLWGVARWA